MNMIGLFLKIILIISNVNVEQYFPEERKELGKQVGFYLVADGLLILLNENQSQDCALWHQHRSHGMMLIRMKEALIHAMNTFKTKKMKKFHISGLLGAGKYIHWLRMGIENEYHFPLYFEGSFDITKKDQLIELVVKLWSTIADDRLRKKILAEMK